MFFIMPIALLMPGRLLGDVIIIITNKITVRNIILKSKKLYFFILSYH